MNFVETRGNKSGRDEEVTFSQAILNPLASFGGLYIPKDLPNLDGFIKNNLNNNIKIIQFHPSYTYEDFVRGIVANTDNNGNIKYEVKDKILMKIAKDARENPEDNYVLIIDEINRANLSSVFGELIYALEYRDEDIESMYAVKEDKYISLPNNLYIIGTMNTTDRSLGNIDYALRRRFVFQKILPNENLLEGKTKDLFSSVKSIIESHITPGFNVEDVMLGHAYFLGNLDKNLEYKIKPLLKEYIKDGILKNSATKEIDSLECKKIDIENIDSQNITNEEHEQ